jgi:hypothetical protein
MSRFRSFFGERQTGFSEYGGLIDIENKRFVRMNVSGDKLVYLHKQAVPRRPGTEDGLLLLVWAWLTSKFPIHQGKVASNIQDLFWFLLPHL